MQLNGIKIHIILVAFIVTLVTALGIQRLWYSQQVVAPVENEFKAFPGVAGVTIDRNGPYLEIVAELENVDDLKAVYRDINDVIVKRFNGEAVKLSIKDRRSPFLEQIYYDIHFDIQEGIATGAFSRMADSVERTSLSEGADKVRVRVDEQFVYVQLYRGDEYLYEIVPRAAATAGSGVLVVGPAIGGGQS